MKTDGLLNYYAEFVDSNGKKHYAIHKYRQSDGWVWSMRDYKFEGLHYPNNINKKRNNNMEINNPTVNIDAKPKFDPNMPMHRPTKYYCVYDKSKRLIAKFRDFEDANEYKAKGLGEFNVVEEDATK